MFVLRGRIEFIDPDNQSTGLAPLGNYFAVLGGSDQKAEAMLRAFDATHLLRSPRTSLKGEIRGGDESLPWRAAHEETAETPCTPNMPPNSSPNLRVAAGKRH